MVQLCFYADRELFDRVRLGERALTIGRGRACNVQLRDERVSRVHVVIRPVPAEGRGGFLYELEDRSLNGTRLNGERVEGAVQLFPGDLIEIEGFVVLHQDDTEPVLQTLGTLPPRRLAR
jgi:pSer/pThr/pTyr-binding forkhead associated (FHA) protein